MSDGASSGGLSGTFELIGQAAQQGAGKVVQGVGGVVSSAAKQVAGTGGVAQSPSMSGSFDMQQGQDLFAPDSKKPTPAPNGNQIFGNAKPLTQAGKDAVSNDRVYTPEEAQKIQSIEAELKSMHAKNNDIEGDMEKARREREEKYQERLQTEQKKSDDQKMGDMQQGQGGQDIATFQAQRGTELAKGNQG